MAQLAGDVTTSDARCPAAVFNVVSAPGLITVTYPNGDGTIGAPNFYLPEGDDTVYVAETAADVAAATGETVTEADQITLSFVTEKVVCSHDAKVCSSSNLFTAQGLDVNRRRG